MAENIDIEKQEFTPQEYFDAVKERKNHITDEQLKAVYDNCLELINKYRITGQRKAIHKLMFHLACIEKERAIVKMGINTFVYRDDIEFYINNVASDTVKIIELENFDREIPDEIVNVIAQTKDMFDKMYVVFTDYTGEVERQVEAERRSKDPILFGVFQDEKSRTIIDRFYYLGDWVDEYCDLTLDKMVNETRDVGKRDIEHTIKTPEDLAELKEQLKRLEPRNDGFVIATTSVAEQKKSFLQNVMTFFSRKKK